MRRIGKDERALYIKMDQGDTLSITRYTSALLAAWALVAVTAGYAAAQPSTGSITGVVTADGGTRMPGVHVTVVHNATGKRDVSATDAEGRYTIGGLPADAEYQISVGIAGFASAETANVKVVPGSV